MCPAHPPAQADACANQFKAPARPVRAAAAAVTAGGLLSLAGLVAIAGVTQNRCFVQSRALAGSLPRLQSPYRGTKHRFCASPGSVQSAGRLHPSASPPPAFAPPYHPSLRRAVPFGAFRCINPGTREGFRGCYQRLQNETSGFGKAGTNKSRAWFMIEYSSRRDPLARAPTRGCGSASANDRRSATTSSYSAAAQQPKTSPAFRAPCGLFSVPRFAGSPGSRGAAQTTGARSRGSRFAAGNRSPLIPIETIQIYCDIEGQECDTATSKKPGSPGHFSLELFTNCT